MRLKTRSSKVFSAIVLLSLALASASFFMTADKALGQTTLNFVGAIDIPPYSFQAGDTPQGYAVDIVKLLGPIIEKNVNIRLLPLDECIEEVLAGKADGILGIFLDKKLEAILSYSDPISEFEYTIFVLSKDRRHVDSLSSLKGKKVAICDDCPIYKELTENNRDITFIPVKTAIDSLYMLKKGKVTAFVGEKNSSLYFAQKHGITDITPVFPALEPVFKYCMAVKKDKANLLGEINLGIAVLTENGALARASRRWFGIPVVEPFPWKNVLATTSGITSVLLVLLILIWVISLNATIKMKTQEIQVMHQKMIEKEKLAVLGKMAGQIAHELRTPLGIMKNSIYLLRSDDPSNKALFEKRLNMLEDKIKLTSNILESILGYSRVQLGSPAEVSPKACVDEVLQDIDVPKNISVKISESEGAPFTVYMDFHQLYSVLRNITLNAIQAMDSSGGLLTVKIFPSENGKKVNIRVCDTGQGIAESARNKIFNLFYSSKITGTGLGLPISKSIVEANQGELRLEESSEQGTCFIITLPSAAAAKKI